MHSRKVCRTLVKLWKSNGVKIAMFIDDGNGIAEERATVDIHSSLVRKFYAGQVSSPIVPKVSENHVLRLNG